MGVGDCVFGPGLVVNSKLSLLPLRTLFFQEVYKSLNSGLLIIVDDTQKIPIYNFIWHIRLHEFAYHPFA